MRRASLPGSIALLLLLACDDPVRPGRDPRTCPVSGGEFALLGCFRVTGTVSPADPNEPGAAATVWLEFVDTTRARGIGADRETPDAAGRFTLEAIRYYSSGLPTTDPDTHTVRVIAHLRAVGGAAPGRLLAADTAIRYVRLAPAGQVAPTDTVDLRPRAEGP